MPPLARRIAPFAIVRRPPIANVFAVQGKRSWRAHSASGGLQRRKVPPKSPSNDDHTAPSNWARRRHPPSPWPSSRFSKYATLLPCTNTCSIRQIMPVWKWANISKLSIMVYLHNKITFFLYSLKQKCTVQVYGILELERNVPTLFVWIHMSIKLASYSYSYSNSSNDFDQNQHTDSPWHAEFENDNHFFLGQTVWPWEVKILRTL